MLFVFLYKYDLTEDETDYFSELYASKEELLNDPHYTEKMKLKHFSTNATFLSNEDEVLLRKGRAVLSVLGEKYDQTVLGCTDFLSRCWEVVRELKTKCTTYDIHETADGWKVYKVEENYKDNYKETTEIKINNETLEVERKELGREELKKEEVQV